MSNNLSMSPNYVKKYALKNNLVKPENDIFDLISTKIKKIYQKRTKELNNTKFDGYFKISNALNISKTWNDITPKLIFTSPPYLNIINYTKQNWIKMWMLGYETELDNKKIGLDDFHNINNYLNNFLIKFMKECHQIMNDKSKLIMVIGDVNRNNKVFSIYDHISLIEKETNLILKEIYIDEINQNSKATNSFGSKAGKATQVEKIYVFKKK
ncbi:DNA methyltransferase [Metamycoplasma alkalescens]|uniref:DNA methyltransferase n=1 Tax=Metamycoplasma alkalescens TaxID=45363 RepID=UPI00039B2529|nr:DNA methyltransferase [Metamycoplasma alkalescens]